MALVVAERLRGRFGPNAAFIPFATVTQPELVLDVIGRAVGAGPSGAGSTLKAIVEHFGNDPWLLVLDNLEQVVEAARDVDEVLARCPGVVIVATSRTVLRLRAEWEYPVPPLPVPSSESTIDELAALPSVALFVNRARAVHHGFALSERNALAVVEICKRLEGIPLAIELAAARTRLLEPDTLLCLLTSSLDALGTGAVDMPERQRTLRATVDWSVGLLDEPERSLLETVAVFADGWQIEAAAKLSSVDAERALELTEALARHSLVHLDTTDRGPRSRMLETIREFVAERLAARPDSAEIEQRHADYFRELAEQADQPLRRAGQAEWAERLDVEAGNLAACVRWRLVHDPGRLPHLFRTQWLFWWLCDHMSEAHGWIGQALSRSESPDVHSRAELFWAAAVTSVEVGDDVTALAARERLEPLLDAIDDPFLHAISLLALAWTAPIDGDLDSAFRQSSVAVEELRGQDEPFWTAMAVATLGFVETVVGRHDEAFRHLSEVRALGERFDNAFVTAGARVQLGTLALERGQVDAARDLLDEGLELSVATNSTQTLTLCLVAFARLALVEGEPERAALVAGAAEGLRQRAGLREWPTERQRDADLVGRIRDVLGADRFDDVFAAGAGLNRMEAVATVRDWRRPARATGVRDD